MSRDEAFFCPAPRDRRFFESEMPDTQFTLKWQAKTQIRLGDELWRLDNFHDQHFDVRSRL